MIFYVFYRLLETLFALAGASNRPRRLPDREYTSERVIDLDTAALGSVVLGEQMHLAHSDEGWFIERAVQLGIDECLSHWSVPFGRSA